MLRFIARRLVLLIPVAIGILLVTFIIVHSIPGDPCKAMLGERATEEKCYAFRERYGLNDNLLIQFGRYIGNMAQGDFGDSIRFSRPVTDIIAERLPMTIELTIFAMLFSTTLGIFFGVVSALRPNSMADTLTMIGANIGVSMPVFWLGLLLAYFFALIMRGTPLYIPPSGRLSGSLTLPSLAAYWGMSDLTGIKKFVIYFLSNSSIFNSIVTGNWTLLKDALWHLILPSIAVGTIPMAIIARMTRSTLIEVMQQDYIRTVRAKGAREQRVVWRHAMRNVMIPIITIIGIETGALLSGAVLTETVFSLPGVGTILVNAILSRDYPVVQGFTVVIATIFVLINLLVDVSYAFLDPRVRLD
jgi:peptide/nickel transport system permease protein